MIPLHVLGVDFGYDKRNVVVHAPLRRVVNDDCAYFGKYRSKLLGYAATCREKREIDFAFERDDIFFCKFDDGVLLAHKIYLFARTFCGCEKIVVVHGKLSFGENFEKFASDHACCADNGDVKLFHIAS